MQLKSRLLILTVLCCALVFVVLGQAPRSAAAACTCLHWVVVGTPCDKDCVAAWKWCQSNPAGTYHGPYVDVPCNVLLKNSVAWCDRAYDCYQCTLWSPPGCGGGGGA